MQWQPNQPPAHGYGPPPQPPAAPPGQQWPGYPLGGYPPGGYPPQPPPAKAPGSVTFACFGLIGLAVLALAEFAMRLMVSLRLNSMLVDVDPNLLGYAVELLWACAFAAVYVWLALKIRRGRRWATITVTAIVAYDLVLAIWQLVPFVYVFAPASAFDEVTIGAGLWLSPLPTVLRMVLAVAVLAALWVSAGSRAYLAGRRQVV